MIIIDGVCKVKLVWFIVKNLATHLIYIYNICVDIGFILWRRVFKFCVRFVQSVNMNCWKFRWMNLTVRCSVLQNQLQRRDTPVNVYNYTLNMLQNTRIFVCMPIYLPVSDWDAIPMVWCAFVLHTCLYVLAICEWLALCVSLSLVDNCWRFCYFSFFFGVLFICSSPLCCVIVWSNTDSQVLFRFHTDNASPLCNNSNRFSIIWTNARNEMNDHNEKRYTQKQHARRLTNVLNVCVPVCLCDCCCFRLLNHHLGWINNILLNFPFFSVFVIGYESVAEIQYFPSQINSLLFYTFEWPKCTKVFLRTHLMRWVTHCRH